jgi:hypothetical protein
VVAVISTEDVRSREDLVRFFADLSEEIYAGRATLENATSGDLVEAASRWVQDMDGFFFNRGEEVPSEPSWELIAQIIAASLVYE